jgi:hypothetical protein
MHLGEIGCDGVDWDQTFTRPLFTHRTTHTHTQIFMPLVRFEQTTLVSERAKAALARAAAVIALCLVLLLVYLKYEILRVLLRKVVEACRVSRC